MFTTLSDWWNSMQLNLFDFLEEELGSLSEKHLLIIQVLEMARVEQYIPYVAKLGRFRGRPPKSRKILVRAFVAKSVLNLPTTRAFIDRLKVDNVLRRICGWEKKSDIPDESTFSRAFAEFSGSKLPQRAHEALIQTVYSDSIVGHLSRDSTAIHGREKPVKKPKKKKEQLQKKRGRPKKGEERPEKEQSRLARHPQMSLEDMLKDLPSQCDVGIKKNSSGHTTKWTGYKLHIDSADGQIPISAVLTSASVHDSQLAIPLAVMSSNKVDSLYDLMDAAYDCREIREFSKSLGHVALIDENPRGNKELKKQLELESQALKTLNWKLPEKRRYNERSNAERVNARLKDDYGGDFIRVRGAEKVMCHLSFGLLALAVDQLVKLVS